MNLIETVAAAFVNKHLSQTQTQDASPSVPAPEDRSLWKALVAGAVAGAVATAAKSAAEKIYPPRVHNEPEPPSVLAEKVAGHGLEPDTKSIATETIHWGFGITVGAAYGAIAEFYPTATGRNGVNFGMTLMALTHESALPAFGLSATPGNQTQREKTSEVATHVVYGLVAETVRRIVRHAL